MISVIFGKPMKTVEIVGYGVEAYLNKDNTTVYKVYGIVKHGEHSHIVKRDDDGKTYDTSVYTDPVEVVLYRSSDKTKAERCKIYLDLMVLHGAKVFSVDEYKHNEEIIRENIFTPKPKQENADVVDAKIVKDDKKDAEEVKGE